MYQPLTEDCFLQAMKLALPRMNWSIIPGIFYQPRNTANNSFIPHTCWKVHVGRSKFKCLCYSLAGPRDKVKIGSSHAALTLLVYAFGPDATSLAVFSVSSVAAVSRVGKAAMAVRCWGCEDHPCLESRLGLVLEDALCNSLSTSPPHHCPPDSCTSTITVVFLVPPCHLLGFTR